MDQIIDDDEDLKIGIKGPFQPKFMKELNHMQNQKFKKMKKKVKEQSAFSIKKLQKFQTLGISHAHKSIKKLPQMVRNGNKIFGVWKNNQIHGQAQIHYSNGIVFKGTYQNGIKIKGHFKFLNGYEYIGHCLGNKFNGEGSLVFPSGKIISGEWKDYFLVDKGKIQYPNGQVYYGQIRNFKKEGKGYLFFTDGTKYIGQFEDGLITGYGTFYVDGEATHTGNWINGQLQESIDLGLIQTEKDLNENVEEVVCGLKTNKELQDIENKALKKENDKKKSSKSGKKIRFASIKQTEGNLLIGSFF